MGEIGEGGRGLPQAHGARTSAPGARRSELASRYKQVSRYNKEPPLTKHKGSLAVRKHEERFLTSKPMRFLTSMPMSRPEMRRCVRWLVWHM